LLVLFLATTLVLAVVFGWLTWRLIEQDRALERQRTQERLDHAADLISAALLRSLSQLNEQIGRIATLPESQLATEVRGYGEQLANEEAAIVVLNPSAVESYPDGRLFYLPLLPPSREAPVTLFARGEAFEFQQKDYAKAIAAFSELARSEDPAVKAGALLRLARNFRKAGRPEAALATYEELARLGSATIEGLSAELLARHARCGLLDELGQRAALQQEARSFYSDLHKSKWKLDRAAYHFYAEEAWRWFSPDQRGVGDENGLAFSEGAEALWDEWQRIRRGEGKSTGRDVAWGDDRSVLQLWHSTPERLIGLIAAPRYFERRWVAALSSWGESQGVRVALTDVEGHQVLGQLAGGTTQQVVRTASDTGLPWTLHVVGVASGLALPGGRHSLLLAGLAIMAMVVLVGSYFIARAVTRELEVARLQSDFVSAVSHEFRTPLTSICQLSELLADGRVSSEQRRNEYYEGLRRQSQRLHRLVEALLDFGRMEAGTREYLFESFETAALVREVADEFAQEVGGRGYNLEIGVNNHLPRVRADREAFGRALWNLLDNAVKYSPHCKTICLTAEQEGDQVAIRVRDEGLGIAPDEQRRIFKKFVRASSAEAAGAKGTGLGLAMVRHIARAHGGEVRVESEPGAGSTFTMLLPKM
jgi:signal transduction histidine kinase